MRARHVGRRISGIAIAATTGMLGVLVGVPGPVAAAVAFTVNSTVDAPDAAAGNGVCAAANGTCTLRAAVEEAGRTAASTTINLPVGRYELSSASPNAFSPGSKALEIASNVTILGAGAASTSIVAAVGHRVLDVEHFVVSRSASFEAIVAGVTITGGSASYGGGILTGRDVSFTLRDSVVTGNAATVSGGGLLAYGEPGYSANITLTRVTVNNNSAWQGGGMVAMYPVTTTISGSTFQGNAATGPYAGGIRNLGSMAVTDTTIVGNYAGFNNSSGAPGGGGVYTGAPPNPGGGQRSSFVMTGGSLISNSLPMNLLSSGGGLLNEIGGTATLNGVYIAGNRAFTGGGILNDQAYMTVNTSVVAGNEAFYGGGVYNNDFNPVDGFPATMVVLRSTLSGNKATDTNCPYQLIPPGNVCGAGGGAFSENGELVLVNSTVAENSASTFGGGIYNLRIGQAQPGQALVRLVNSTVSANVGVREGGGLLGNTGVITAKNSIVADNQAGSGPSDCFNVPGSYMSSLGNNITTDVRCGFVAAGDRFGSPQLSPLAANGGTTATMLPYSGSNALGGADASVCAAYPVAGVDQRGVSRPAGNGCDVGAVEGETARPSPTNAARPATYLNGVYSIRTSATTGPSTAAFPFGLATDQALMCDFDGDGTRSATVARLTGSYLTWYGRRTNNVGAADFTFAFGAAGDTAICGDWDGNGTDTPGILRNVGGARLWIQSNQYGGSGALTVFYFGAAADLPMYGDWDGNGTDTPGITRAMGYAMLWSIRNSNTGGSTEGEFYFGIGTDRPVVGDWNNDGSDSPGVARPDGASLRWWTRNTIVNGAATGTFLFGGPFDRPMVWKGSGVAGL